MENDNVVWLDAERVGTLAPQPESEATPRAAVSDPDPTQLGIAQRNPPARACRKNWAYWRKPTRRIADIPLRAGERWKRRLPKACR